MLRAAAKWPIWRQRPVLISAILAVDFSAVLVPALSWQPITRSDIEIMTGLVTLSIAYSTFTCSAERVRRTLHQGAEAIKYSNLLAIWGFTAAVLLPLQLTCLIAVAGAVAEWPARRVVGRARPYRHVYSTAVAVLAATATHSVCSFGLDQWLGVALGVPAYMAVEILLIAAAMLAAGEQSAARGLLRPSLYRVELCCLAMAIGVLILVETDLGMLVWLSLPAAIGLQRIVTRSRLRYVTDDAQTSPMTEEAWFIVATEVVAASPVVAVIRVTTTNPAAVSAVAQLQSGSDAIGYLGADGLGMLLVDCPSLSAEKLAARLRVTFQTRGLVADVAAAAKPRDGSTLNDLLALCEAELVTRQAAGLAGNPLRPEP